MRSLKWDYLKSLERVTRLSVDCFAQLCWIQLKHTMFRLLRCLTVFQFFVNAIWLPTLCCIMVKNASLFYIFAEASESTKNLWIILLLTLLIPNKKHNGFLEFITTFVLLLVSFMRIFERRACCVLNGSCFYLTLFLKIARFLVLTWLFHLKCGLKFSGQSSGSQHYLR